MAAYRLAAGDALVTPVQSPETLGFDLEFPNDAAVVGDPAARTEAARFYLAARDAYLHAESPGGVAAVNLRLGWLQRLGGEDDAGMARLDRAVVGFTTAGDGPGLALALTHRAIADLAAGRLAASCPGTEPELTAWGTGPGSRSYVVGCARLVDASAHTFRDEGRIESAVAALDLVRRLYAGLGDHGCDGGI